MGGWSSSTKTRPCTLTRLTSWEDLMIRAWSLFVFWALVATVAQEAAAQDVLQHHGNSTRDGLYVDPLFTQKAAANIHRDPVFRATLPGPTYAQPLFVSDGPNSRPALIVATEQNVVLALDADDGSELWR